jgi:electron transfer flavoprotein alpha subunit
MDFSYIDDWPEEEALEEAIAEVGEGYRNIWTVVETSHGTLVPAALEALGQARELADQIGVYAYAVILGSGVEALGESLIAYGADKVLVADDPALAVYQPETYGSVLADLVVEYRPEILLLPATALGNELAPWLAQRLNTGLISHCWRLGLDMAERLLLGTIAVMGGEVFHTMTCPQSRPQMATLEPGHFRTPFEDTTRSGDVQRVEVTLEGGRGAWTWVDLDASVELPPVPLSKAHVVVSAGRGMGDADGFALVERLAAALDGVVAGSRGAFDEGWVPEERIVGVGGELIAPDLYIACGISGDIHHYYGLQDARFVVAINTDEKAPIMKAANIAVVGDARQVIPAMLDALSA